MDTAFFWTVTQRVVPTFRDNLWVPSSNVKNPKGTLNTRPICCPETSARITTAHCLIAQKSAVLISIIFYRRLSLSLIYNPLQTHVFQCDASQSITAGENWRDFVGQYDDTNNDTCDVGQCLTTDIPRIAVSLNIKSLRSEESKQNQTRR
jgi:hypothetical protein